jgi:hypothetical protein
MKGQKGGIMAGATGLARGLLRDRDAFLSVCRWSIQIPPNAVEGYG